MPSQSQNQGASPFEIVTPAKGKKTSNRNLIIIISIVAFLILSVVAGVLLVRQQQNVQEQAAQTLCPAAEQCPNTSNHNLLQSCHPQDADGTTNDSLCSYAGRVETCGATSTKYCCPAAGGAWTADMTVCNSLASPTPSPTPTQSPSPTPTATPISCNGTCSSDSACQSGFICSSGNCRNPVCTSQVDCTCVSSTATPVPTLSVNSSATPVPVPVTGVDWPTIAGVGVGAGAIILSILVAL